MAEATGSLVVVVGAGTRRPQQRRERLCHEGVDEPVVVREPGQNDLLLARRACDRGSAREVLTGLGAGVAVRVVTEFCEHPGTENRSQTWLGRDDLGDRVLPEMDLDPALAEP